MAEEYVYAVTRVHIHEQKLLNVKDFEQMINSGSISEALDFLEEKGWEVQNFQGDVDAIIEAENDRLWTFIRELVDDLSPFDVFCTIKDFHNLKAAIKLHYSGEIENTDRKYYLKHGIIDVGLIEASAKTRDFTKLPKSLSDAGKAAYEALTHTGNGQACDIEMDRAALLAVAKAGKDSKSALLQEYAELTVDLANIKSAVRCCRMRKSRDFTERVLADAGTLDTRRLAAAAETSIDDISEYLKGSKYGRAAAELEKSLAAFERYCDNELIGLIKPQKGNYFTIEPIAAYILARENEIKMVKLILSALENHLNSEMLHERLRDTYV